MENEQSILDATEYILMALNNIKNYNEFREYKDEIIKAIYDIRNSIKALIASKKSYIDNQSKNPKSISSMLGLKFNYDSYLNEIQLKNLTNNVLGESDNQVKFEQNQSNDDINSMNENQKSINSQDKKEGVIKDEKIICNKSLRNKFKVANNEDKSNEQIKENNKDEKFNLIADIIMKINSEDYFYEILTKLFGEDLTDKLMANDVSDELLEAVQNSIKEIEELKKKDKLNELNDKKNIEEKEEQPKKFPIEQMVNQNIKNKKNNNNSNYKYQEFDFTKSLRNPGVMKDKNKVNIKEKPFISATSSYGNYFDPPLQKGGFSKLDVYKKIMNA